MPGKLPKKPQGRPKSLGKSAGGPRRGRGARERVQEAPGEAQELEPRRPQESPGIPGNSPGGPTGSPEARERVQEAPRGAWE